MLHRSRVSGAIDASRLRALVRGPGVDTRTWVSLAVVLKTKVDLAPNAEGFWVDVLLLPYRQEETAFVGSVYAGDGFGLYVPLEKDDLVEVKFSQGDPEQGLIVGDRLWSSSDKPSADFNDAQGNPRPDVVLHVKPGSHLHVIAESTSNVTFEVRGTGKVGVGGEPGSVGMEPMVLGQTLQSNLTLLDAWVAAVQTFLTGLGFVYPPGPPSFPDVRALKGDVK